MYNIEEVTETKSRIGCTNNELEPCYSFNFIRGQTLQTRSATADAGVLTHLRLTCFQACDASVTRMVKRKPHSTHDTSIRARPGLQTETSNINQGYIPNDVHIDNETIETHITGKIET